MATPATTLPSGHVGAASGGRYYKRFDRIDRLMHGFLMVTFIGCALTGIPLLVADHAWAQGFARMLGGFKVTMLIHRICAAIMIVVFVGHVVRVFAAAARTGKWLEMVWGPNSMVPNLKDAEDVVGHVKWFVGHKNDGRRRGLEEEQVSYHGARGEKLETIDVGSRKSPKSICIYDKIRQIYAAKGGDASTYSAAWTAGGWKPGEALTRVELRIKEHALVIERANDAGEVLETVDLRRLENLADPAKLALAWRYHLEKMRLIVPDSATRRERSAMDPRWSYLLSCADAPEGWDPQSWRCRRKPQKEAVLRSVDRSADAIARSECRLVEMLSPVPEPPPDSASPEERQAWSDRYDREREKMARIVRRGESYEQKVEHYQRSRNTVDAHRHHYGPELLELSAYYAARHGHDLAGVSRRRSLLSPEWRARWLLQTPGEIGHDHEHEHEHDHGSNHRGPAASAGLVAARASAPGWAGPTDDRPLGARQGGPDPTSEGNRGRARDLPI